MVITRKIEVFITDDDPQKKKDLRHTVYEWRDWVRKAANVIVAHKFVQQNVADFTYFTDAVREAFGIEDKDGKRQWYVKEVLSKEPGNSEQNTTYRIVARMLKGKVPADIYSCLNQAVSKTFKETLVDYLKGKASVRSYKNSIPMPFSAKALQNIHKADDGKFYFTLFGVPFACRLGRDRSNNELVIDRCIDGEYKLCSSSLMIDDARKKMYLLLCVDIPKKDVQVDEKKVLSAYLDVDVPIRYSVGIKAKKDYDSGEKFFTIGSKEEYLYPRQQIQAAVWRCQKANRYAKGGKGRTRKCQAIERWHEKEKNYIQTKLHLYSKLLVDEAVKRKCGTILLVNQKEREDKAKEDNQHGEPFVLRNWTYYGLKDKISYKAKRFGILIKEDNMEVESA